MNSLRDTVAELPRLPPDRVRCIYAEGAGCYGHDGADDVAADAALAAMGVPGRPVKLRWTREQEHGWEPLGPARLVEVTGAVDRAGRIARRRHEAWSNTHSTRPAAAGDLLAGLQVDPPFAPTPPKPLPQPEGGGDHDAIPLHQLSNLAVEHHFLPDMPPRVSAPRSLGAHMNVFAIESFTDELARAAAQFGWSSHRRAPSRGTDMGLARHKNIGGYRAGFLDVEIIHRVVAAIDSGEAVNPDGIRDQVEGGIVQSLGSTGPEHTDHDERHRRAYDWSVYPIARFDEVSLTVELEVVDRPGRPFLGAGEA